MFGSKFTKFLLFLKQKRSFSSNFAPLFGMIRHNPPYFFLAETSYTFSKSILTMYKFGKISPEQSKVWTFALWWASFCQNEIKFQLKKYRRFIAHGIEKAKFKEKLTCGFKYDMRNLVNFHPTTQKFESFTPMGYFCPKYMRFELKKYTGVISHDTEWWCKIWKTLTLWFQK